MSSKNGLSKAKTMDMVKDLQKRMRCQLKKLIQMAALWWRETHGRRIKAASVKEAIRSSRRQSFRPPEWFARWVEIARAEFA